MTVDDTLSNLDRLSCLFHQHLLKIAKLLNDEIRQFLRRGAPLAYRDVGPLKGRVVASIVTHVEMLRKYPKEIHRTQLLFILRAVIEDDVFAVRH